MLTLVEFGASYDIFQVGRNGTATLDGGFSMVLYEVNLVVQKHLDGDYRPWLRAHIKEMLEFQGFERASLWLETDSEQDDACAIPCTTRSPRKLTWRPILPSTQSECGGMG